MTVKTGQQTDMVISVTKHVPGPSPTLPGPLNVRAPRMFHLPQSGEDRIGGGVLLQGFVPIIFWPGGVLEFQRETGKEWVWAKSISGVC